MKSIIINESQYRMLFEYAGYANVWESLIDYAIPIIRHKYKNGEDNITISGNILKKIGIPDMIYGFNFIIENNDKDSGGFFFRKIHRPFPNSDNDESLFYAYIALNKNIIFEDKLYDTLLHELTHFYEMILKDKHKSQGKNRPYCVACNDNTYYTLFKLLSYYLQDSELNAFLSELYSTFERFYDEDVNNGFHCEDNPTVDGFREGFYYWDLLDASNLYFVMNDAKEMADKCMNDPSFIDGLIAICNSNSEAKELFGKLYSSNHDVFAKRLNKFLMKKFFYIDSKAKQLYDKFIYSKLYPQEKTELNKQSLDLFSKRLS